jgi:hypothetical protein
MSLSVRNEVRHKTTSLNGLSEGSGSQWMVIEKDACSM